MYVGTNFIFVLLFIHTFFIITLMLAPESTHRTKNKTLEDYRKINLDNLDIRDYIKEKISVDEDYRIVEVDLNDYDLSEKTICELRNLISESNPYLSYIFIESKNQIATWRNCTLSYLDVPIEDFKESIDLIRINKEFIVKEMPFGDIQEILRELYLLTGIKEIRVFGELREGKAFYDPKNNTVSSTIQRTI